MLSTKHFSALASALLLTLAAPLAMSATVDPKDCTQPEFPARWLNEGDSGNVVVAFLVGADGKILDSKLVESSGYPRVDRASIRAGASCKFKPASDQSAATWAKVKYTWIVD
ncbi:energy transducer TonB [Massilia sp. CF038]|uniref:energy transducer TonB n=1 Tax=Massilia sp. CF038 TaxID=1881045 RepID=UPI0009F9101C|nr:energy transducer TonB [Massilia sp. CF038]